MTTPNPTPEARIKAARDKIRKADEEYVRAKTTHELAIRELDVAREGLKALGFEDPQSALQEADRLTQQAMADIEAVETAIDAMSNPRPVFDQLTTDVAEYFGVQPNAVTDKMRESYAAKTTPAQVSPPKFKITEQLQVPPSTAIAAPMPNIVQTPVTKPPTPPAPVVESADLDNLVRF